MPSIPAAPEPLLEVRGLTLGIGTGITAVQDLGFTLKAGETLALVGESGCGKSLSALALMRLLPPAVRILAGDVRFAGQPLLDLPEAAMRRLRGRELAMIFQEPATSLNPVLTIYQQIAEVLARHPGLTGKAARERAEALLHQVGIPDPARRLDEYPFQFSGGMKQRAMIAMALAGEPRLLIADEPTTALDVTVQAQILDLLQSLQAERGMAMLLITHDLGIVARLAGQVGVMYAGQLVERAGRDNFFRASAHPYSQALFAALPEAVRRGERLLALPGQVPALAALPAGCRFAGRCARAAPICRERMPEFQDFSQSQAVRCHFPGPAHASAPTSSPANVRMPPAEPPTAERAALLQVRDLRVHFPIRKGVLLRISGWVRAVDGLDLALSPGRTLALVGESGCGKSTVARALMQLLPRQGGEIIWRGQPLPEAGRAQRMLRRKMQMVFQDPFASLNPRLSIGDILLEGMRALQGVPDAASGRAACRTLLAEVGLDAEALDRYPHQFSGGQRQRIAIARALAVSPEVLICDEPTSALDVSVQAQILNLFKDLQARLQIAYLFITHNFAVVEYLADSVAVMYLGRVVERGPVGALLDAPAHPYTRALLAAVPRLGERAREARPPGLAGETPSPVRPPDGCHFHPRCPAAMAICRRVYPPGRDLADGRWVACHLHT